VSPHPGVAWVNGIRIAYETLGERSQPPLLLIMGVGASLVNWDDEFCAMLVAHGFYVIRFDNRDVGRSSWVQGVRTANLIDAYFRPARVASYTLDDMVTDTFGLLDHLGIASAHVVGVSLGGHIAQMMAVRSAARVRSLTSIMSSTGDRSVRPRAKAVIALARPMPRGREAAIDQMLRASRVVGSPRFPWDENRLRRQFGAAYDRGMTRAGAMRQTLATLASGDRTALLQGITVPTVVIHGSEDPLIPVGGGRATAAAIPGAELVTIPGMGHDLPPGVWPRVVGAIAHNAARAEE
jgi:pimeloyl-ACP methyl ester carboxylesterase